METSIETEPVPQDVSLERRGSTVVAVPREGRPALTAVEVEETIAQLRPGEESVCQLSAARFNACTVSPSRWTSSP